MDDKYDFDKWSKKNWDDNSSVLKNIAGKVMVDINNNAYEQQELNQLEKFLLSRHIIFTQKEIEEILNKYGTK